MENCVGHIYKLFYYHFFQSLQAKKFFFCLSLPVHSKEVPGWAYNILALEKRNLLFNQEAIFAGSQNYRYQLWLCDSKNLPKKTIMRYNKRQLNVCPRIFAFKKAVFVETLYLLQRIRADLNVLNTICHSNPRWFK